MRTIAVADEPELTELLAVLVGQGFRIADRTPTSAIVKRRHRPFNPVVAVFLLGVIYVAWWLVIRGPTYYIVVDRDAATTFTPRKPFCRRCGWEHPKKAVNAEDERRWLGMHEPMCPHRKQ